MRGLIARFGRRTRALNGGGSCTGFNDSPTGNEQSNNEGSGDTVLGSGDTIPGMFRRVASDRPPAPGYATMNNGWYTSPRLTLLPSAWGGTRSPGSCPQTPPRCLLPVPLSSSVKVSCRCCRSFVDGLGQAVRVGFPASELISCLGECNSFGHGEQAKSG